MRINFERRNGRSPNGKIVIYDNYVVFSEGEGFEEMMKSLTKKHKLNLTDVFGRAVQLFYEKEEGKVTVFEDRVLDVYRLARQKNGLKKIERAFSRV